MKVRRRSNPMRYLDAQAGEPSINLRGKYRGSGMLRVRALDPKSDVEKETAARTTDTGVVVSRASIKLREQVRATANVNAPVTVQSPEEKAARMIQHAREAAVSGRNGQPPAGR